MANHHSVPVVKLDGTTGFSCRRDSAPGKRPVPASSSVVGEANMTEAVDVVGEFLKGTKRTIDEVDDPSAPSASHMPPRPSREAPCQNSLSGCSQYLQA